MSLKPLSGPERNVSSAAAAQTLRPAEEILLFVFTEVSLCACTLGEEKGRLQNSCAQSR